MEIYSGKVIIRMPRDLHKRLALLAEQNGVELEQYIVYLLSSNQVVASSSSQQLEERLDHSDSNSNIEQDTNSGKRGNEVGRLIGQAVAERLNIELLPGSNRSIYGDRKIVIKSARLGNTLIGITNKMLDEIEGVILARETTEGQFDLYMADISNIRSAGRPTRSRGASSGRVTNFSISEVIRNGSKFDEMSIDLPYPPNSLR